jgi:MarR family transcriptional regulator for hemolysin
MNHVFDEFADMLHATDHAWRNAIDRRLRPLGISRSNWRILAMLNLHGEMSQGRLAELLSVEGPTVVRLVDKLERDGVVERVLDPADRRIRNVRLTESGKKAIKPIQRIIHDFRVDVFKQVGDKDMAATIRFLSSVRTVVADME